MPYPMFDRSQLNLLPLEERIHDVQLGKVLIPALGQEAAPEAPEAVKTAALEPTFSHPAIPELADAIVRARREHDAAVLMMYGAHVIRTGNGALMIDLMKRGLVTHFATNGAGSIHDFELAPGKTCIADKGVFIQLGSLLCGQTYPLGIFSRHQLI